MNTTSRKPYLLRALVEWAEDNGLTPLITARVDPDDGELQVPAGYVNDGHITLNISPAAMNRRELGNDFVTGFARFAGRSEYLKIPLRAVQALMVKETGEGMAFPDEAPAQRGDELPSPIPIEPGPDDHPPTGGRPAGGRPHLRVIK